jgi:hypothetical protein
MWYPEQGRSHDVPKILRFSAEQNRLERNHHVPHRAAAETAVRVLWHLAGFLIRASIPRFVM